MTRREVKRDRDGLTRCRVCGCTEADACPGGCGWADDDLCTVCDTASEAVAAWLMESRWANRAALWREAEQILRREVS